MTRRVITAREQVDMLAPWLVAALDQDLHDYRVERHRQEVELEGLTGGNATDTEDYFARGGKPLITYKDWLRGRKGWGGVEEPMDPDFVYTPPAGSDDVPAWAREGMRRIITAWRIVGFDPTELTKRLRNEFYDWHEAQPPKRNLQEEMNSPLGHWPTIEKFLQHKYPAAHRGFLNGMEDASEFLNNPSEHDPLYADEFPYEEDPEKWAEPYQVSHEEHQQLGYDPEEIAAGMVLLHNKAHGYRGGYEEGDKARLVDIFNKRQKMQRDYEQRTAVNNPQFNRYFDQAIKAMLEGMAKGVPGRFIDAQYQARLAINAAMDGPEKTAARALADLITRAASIYGLSIRAGRRTGCTACAEGDKR